MRPGTADGDKIAKKAYLTGKIPKLVVTTASHTPKHTVFALCGLTAILGAFIFNTCKLLYILHASKIQEEKKRGRHGETMRIFLAISFRIL